MTSFLQQMIPPERVWSASEGAQTQGNTHQVRRNILLPKIPSELNYKSNHRKQPGTTLMLKVIYLAPHWDGVGWPLINPPEVLSFVQDFSERHLHGQWMGRSDPFLQQDVF